MACELQLLEQYYGLGRVDGTPSEFQWCLEAICIGVRPSGAAEGHVAQ